MCITCHDAYDYEDYEAGEVPPVEGTQCHDEAECPEELSAEEVLASSVREWAETIVPGDEATIRAAVGTAISTFARGESLTEACEDARRVVGSRIRHPSGQRYRPTSVTFGPIGEPACRR